MDVDGRFSGIPPAELVATARAQAWQLLEQGRLDDMTRLSHDVETHLRRLSADDGPDAVIALADLLDDRSAHLSAIGDLEAARATAEEAVALARTSTAPATVLGSALTSFGTCLAQLGRPDEALAAHEEALAVLRALPERTGAVHDRANLAGALDNYGNRLAEAGRPADGCVQARAGVALRRQLAQEHPGVYHDDLARSLNNLGGRLGELGDPGAAGVLAEAVAAYRSTPHRTGKWAYEFAVCLFNAATVAARAGRITSAHADASEAVALLRPLAEAYPARFAALREQISVFLFHLSPPRVVLGEARAFAMLRDAESRREQAMAEGDAAGLRAAIGLMEDAVPLLPADHPYAVAVTGELCGLHRLLFEWTAAPEALDRAVAVGEEAVLAGAGHPALGLLQSNLGIALRVRYEVTGSWEDLRRAVECGRQAVGTLGSEHPEQPLARANFAAALRAQADLTGDRRMLAGAVRQYEACLSALPADHPRRAPVTGDLAMTIFTRYELTGDPADAARARELSRAALDGMPPGHPDRGLHLNNASIIATAGADPAATAYDRYARSGSPADLDDAIGAIQAGLASGDTDDAGQARRLALLQQALADRFEAAGREDDLDLAIATVRERLDLLVAYHPERTTLLLRLSVLLVSQAARTADPDTAAEGVEHARTVLRTAAQQPDVRATALTCLASALNRWFYVSGERNALDEAVTAAREAAAVAADEYLRGGATQILAMALRARAMHDGGQNDLDEAIRLGRDNLRVAGGPAEAMPTSTAMSDLAHALLVAYQRSGDLSYLDEAIERMSGILRADTTATTREVASHAALFGGLLRHRYMVRRDLADLNAAVAITEWASRSGALAGGGQADAANQHALAVTARLAELGDPADADAAVEAARLACAALPEDSPDARATRLILATALQNRYLFTGRLSDLAEAGQAAADALARVPSGHPVRGRYLQVVAGIHFKRYEATGREPDLQAAVDSAEEAVRGAVDGEPYQAAYLAGLAAMYLAMRRPSAAMDLLDQAAVLSSVPAVERAEAAVSGADIAAGLADWPRARDFYAVAVGLLPLITWRGMHRAAREDQLVRRAGWAADAAAAALNADDRPSAIELAEHGRNVLWDQTRQMSMDLTALRRADPALADRAKRLRADLDSTTRGSGSWSAETDALVSLVRPAGGS